MIRTVLTQTFISMKKQIAIIFFLITNLLLAQTNQLWKGYFSYNGIKDLTQSDTRFFAASENALFSKNVVTNEISTINTIDGLSSQTISAIYYSATNKKILVGYENGLLIVIDEKDNKIFKFVDIINKQLPPNIKRINHFYRK